MNVPSTTPHYFPFDLLTQPVLADLIFVPHAGIPGFRPLAVKQFPLPPKAA
jgi:hypothetical protein